MMKTLAVLSLMLLLTSGCSRPRDQHARQGETNVVASPRRKSPAGRPTVDPTSSEAAEELARGFAALLNAGRRDDAYMLLGPGAGLRRDFERNLDEFTKLHVTVQRAMRQEGAAGSVYVSVPLTFSGSRDNRRLSRSATAIMRRVNDVPGSTEAERHWHIERIEWPQPPRA